jgi:hypothetical protein
MTSHHYFSVCTRGIFIPLPARDVKAFLAGRIGTFDTHAACLMTVDTCLRVPPEWRHQDLGRLATLGQEEADLGNPLNAHEMSPLKIGRAFHRISTHRTQGTRLTRADKGADRPESEQDVHARR